jgi:hypothetical protein
MRRYLVVAHQTLGSPELLEAMRDLLSESACTFHLVVPQYHGGGLTWDEGEVALLAEQRLEEARLRFTAEGLAVTGEVGDSNPIEAVMDVIRREGEGFDGVVVSTLPHNVSKWLRVDAPHRIERRTGLTVVHVIGQPAATPAAG